MSFYLCNQEVHVLLDKDVDLFLEDGLHVVLALAAEVSGGLRDSSRHQSTTFIGHLPGQVTSSLVDLLPLKSGKKRKTLECVSSGDGSTGFLRPFFRAGENASSAAELPPPPQDWR